MSQILGVHIGEFGSRVGQHFWQQIAEQHNINNVKSEKDPHGKLVFFEERKDVNKHIARSIFLGMESRTLNQINRNDPYKLFDTKNIMTTKTQSRGIFPEGKYLSGSDIKKDFQELLRKEIQKCDHLSGFLATNSMGQGAGSGLGSLMTNCMRENYPDKMLQCYSLYPDISLAANPLQVYNSVFSTHYFIEQADLVHVIDNISANKILRGRGMINIEQDHNYKLFARGMTEMSSSFRFSGKLNTNQRKMMTNLVMFPRLKFVFQGVSQPQCSRVIHPITSAMSKNNFLGGQAYQFSKEFYQMSIHCRDPMSYEEEMTNFAKESLKERNITQTEWIPNSFHLSHCDEINEKHGKSATVSISSNSVKQLFNKLAQGFTRLFRRKAFIHHYTECGMDQMEFTEAESNLNDIVSEYTPWTNDYGDQELFEGMGIEE